MSSEKFVTEKTPKIWVRNPKYTGKVHDEKEKKSEKEKG